MEEKQVRYGLGEMEPPDGETFRRVWNRVMPDQSLSPVVIRETVREGEKTPVDGQHYIKGIEELMEGSRGWQRRWEGLAKRHQTGKTALALRTLAAAEGRQIRRLSALYFLLTGGRYQPRSGKGVAGDGLGDSLRQGFLQQTIWQGQYAHMVEKLEGEGLKELGEELRTASLEQSRQIRGLLEAGESTMGHRRGISE